MRTLAVLLALGVLVAAAHAGATILPQQGMAGVKLEMTKKQVRAALGEPLGIRRGKNDFGPYTEFRYPFLVSVFFQGDRTVTSVRTSGRKERTAQGIGVGSTEMDVKRKVPGARCKTFLGGFRQCFVGSFRPGTRVTDFQIKRGRVVRVDVGFVID